MTDKLCRWGILGTAGIARKNWESIRNSSNATLVAVASRSVDRAEQFIRECQSCVSFPSAPRGCTYEDLLASSDVDAVYIPLPTGLRKGWVIKAANAGKHVMCEKPCAISAEDLAEMIAACEKNNVQFMDGVMFMHSQRMNRVRETLDDGQSIGQIKRIACGFSFCGSQEFVDGNIRVSSNLEPAGCLGDLGWYSIRFALWTMKYQMPKQVAGRLLTANKRVDSPNPVPMEFSAELFFDGGVSASFYNSFVTEHQQWVSVSGTKGHLVLPDFVLPFYGSEVAFSVHNPKFEVTGCQFNMGEHTRRVAVSEYANNAPNAQETHLFRNFSDLVVSGRRDSLWPEIALKTQQVLDACLKSAHQGGVLVSL